jgi:protein-S-isoprenylcysteine O-methyltransferase Ste14
MHPLYATEALPAALFWVLYVAWFGFEIGNNFRLRRPLGGVSRDRGSKVVLIVGVYAGVFAGFAAGFGAPGEAITWHRHWLFYMGLVLLVAGVGLRAYATRTLGRSFTLEVMTRPEQVVIDSGPYRWIRHPAYAGSLLTVLGILICSTNWLSLACLAPVLVGYGYRIAIEERALALDMGQPYRSYMRRTKRLIPFLF